MARARLAPAAPRPLAPMLASPGRLPIGRAARAFGYELKWDGVRAILLWDGAGTFRVLSRRGLDVAASFPELRPLAEALGKRSAVLDGEIVAFDAKGRPDFGLLQQRLGRVGEGNVAAGVRAVPTVLLLFDLLFLDGRDLTGLPYRERRRRLASLRLEGPAWSTPRHHADGAAVFAASRRLGLEGIVAKRLDSPYQPGIRSPAWVKVRNRMRQEFVVGGWSEGAGSRAGTIGSLLMGHYGSREDPTRLVYVGRVGTGLGGATLPNLLRTLRAMPAPSPFDSSAAEEDGDGSVHFVRPELVAEVEFSGMTKEGRMRQASFKGLRSDKQAREVVWEQVDKREGPYQGAEGRGKREE